MGYRWLGISLLAVVSLNGTALADKEPIYPNVDSLSYWNRIMEARDRSLQLQNQMADQKGIWETETVLLAMKEKLFKKGAVTEHDYREAVWTAESAGFKLKEMQVLLEELAVDEKIFTQQLEWAKTEKEEVVSVLAALYADRWKIRIELQRHRLAQAEAEVRFRDWHFANAQTLLEKHAMSTEEFIRIRDSRDGAHSDRLMAVQRVALAETAYNEAVGTDTQVKMGRLP